MLQSKLPVSVLRTVALGESLTLTAELKAVVHDLTDAADLSVEGLKAPYDLTLDYEQTALSLHLKGQGHPAPVQVEVPVRIFRNVLSDYLRITESFMQASAEGNLQRFEAIDMGKRVLHDEAAEMLAEILAPRVRLGHGTARKLFTLICVLQQHGKTASEVF